MRFASRNKYGARRTIVDGKAFPSMLEAAVYTMLRELERGGVIASLRLQHCVRFPGTRVKSKIDFSFEENGREVFAEAKGTEDLRWKVIKQLWATHGPAPLRIYKGSYRNFKLVETIFPEGIEK